jgi:PAS domain S-box-containing protein
LQGELSDIVDALPGLVWTVLPTGVVDFVNRRWCEFTGLRADDAHGTGWQAAVHPDDVSSLLAGWRSVPANGEAHEKTVRLRQRDGTHRWFMFRFAPLFDPSGAFAKWCSIGTDVDALTASERNLTQIVNMLPTTAWSTEPDGFCDFLNDQWLDYAGFTPEEARGWGWAAVIHPEDAQGLHDHWERCLSSGTPVNTEARMRGKDGTYRWFLFRANPLRGEFGTIVKWYGTNVDIEDRKRADDDLRRSRGLLEKGERLSLTGSFSWPVGTDEVEVSDEFRRIHELEPDVPVMLDRIAARVHPEDLPLLAEKIELAREGGDDLDYEVRLLMGDGSVKFLHTNAYLTRDARGVLEIIGATQDISARRRADNALIETRAELEHVARVTMLGAVTASIAHEVSQPLSAIMTNAGTCLRSLAAQPPNMGVAREAAQRILSDGQRTTDVVARLRSLFAKKSEPPDWLDLNTAAREVVALSANALQRNQVVLREELVSDLPPVRGDRVQLQQVILNLLINASDAMRDVEGRARKILLKTQRDEDDSVRLIVQDVGTGIEPQNERKMFEPFFTTKDGGMGIGLSISHSIIERHGGRLWATANAGHGATFSFSIPSR